MGTMDLPEVVEISMEGDVAHVKLGGNITDHSDLSSVASIRARSAVLDLEELGRMTSRGVRHWMDMIEELCRNVDVVQIENAPHGFLIQYSMIQGMTAKARIESILATYACDRCAVLRTVSLHRANDFPNGRLEPKRSPTCDRCRDKMVPDDLLFELDIAL